MEYLFLAIGRKTLWADYLQQGFTFKYGSCGCMPTGKCDIIYIVS